MIMTNHIRQSEFWHIRQQYIHQHVQAELGEIAIESIRLYCYIIPLYICLCVQAEYDQIL
jgi:hypothetical protein